MKPKPNDSSKHPRIVGPDEKGRLCVKYHRQFWTLMGAWCNFELSADLISLRQYRHLYVEGTPWHPSHTKDFWVWYQEKHNGKSKS